MVTETIERVETVAPDGAVTSTIDGPIEFDESIRVGVRWPIDGLVGQINGRPVFVAEFFIPIEDRLAQLGRDQDPMTARRAIIQIVRERFIAYVNSELIIAEAESELTPEMQQGIFGWLGMMEQQVTAQRGGTRFEAEESIMAETGLTMEEFSDLISRSKYNAHHTAEEMAALYRRVDTNGDGIIDMAELEAWDEENGAPGSGSSAQRADET